MEEQVIVAENTERDATVASPKPNFDLLSDDKYLNNTESTEIEVKPKIKEEEKRTEEVASDLALETEKSSAQEVKTNELVSENVETTEEALLTLDDSTITHDENSWIAYAKSEGIDISEDSPEAYIAAKIEPLQKQLAEVDSKKMEDYFVGIAPEIRMEIELNQAGMSYEDIKAPLDNIAKYQSLTDVELYREDLVLRYPNATQEWIDADIEKAVDSGQISHDAVRIRLDLDNEKNNIINQREQIIEKYKVNKDNFLQEKRRQEVESISKALDNMPEFLGSPISTDVKKGLADRYNTGKYDQLLNDPAMKAKFITYIELGEKAHKLAVDKSYAKGRLEITKELHNTPPLNTGGAGKQIQTGEGNFEKLEGDSHLRG